MPQFRCTVTTKGLRDRAKWQKSCFGPLVACYPSAVVPSRRSLRRARAEPPRKGQNPMLCSSEMKQPINIRAKVDESIDFSALDPMLVIRLDTFEIWC